MRVCEKWEIEQDLVENRIKGLTPAPMIVGQKSINEENVSEENVNEDALFKNGMSWLDENADGEGDEEFFSDMSSDSEDEENDKSKEDGSDSDDDLEKELELELS